MMSGASLLSPETSNHLDLKSAHLFLENEFLAERLQSADKSITSADLSGNLLGTIEHQDLILAFEKVQDQFEALDLSDNLLCYLSFQLPAVLASIRVSHLNLASNRFCNMGYEELAASCHAISDSVKILDLSNNNLNEEYYSLWELRKIIASLHTETVNLRGNNLGDTLNKVDRWEIIQALKESGNTFLLDEPLASECKLDIPAFFSSKKKPENSVSPAPDAFFTPTVKLHTKKMAATPPKPLSDSLQLKR